MGGIKCFLKKFFRVFSPTTRVSPLDTGYFGENTTIRPVKRLPRP